MSKLFNIELDKKQIVERIILVFTEMLIARKLLIEDKKDEYYKQILESDTGDSLFNITVFTIVNNEKDIKNMSSKVYALKIISNKVTTINKDSGLVDFLKKHEKSHKIIVVKEIAPKIANNLEQNPNIEVFTEEKMMYNPLKFELQPKEFTVITDNEFVKEYCISSNGQLMKMDAKDPVAKFLGFKPGQKIRIVRNSEPSCYSVAYRVVVKSSLSTS